MPATLSAEMQESFESALRKAYLYGMNTGHFEGIMWVLDTLQEMGEERPLDQEDVDLAVQEIRLRLATHPYWRDREELETTA